MPTLPGFNVLFAGLVLGLIGLAAFRYHKRQLHVPGMLISVALMVYPYFVTASWALYVVGALLCAALYVFRR